MRDGFQRVPVARGGAMFDFDKHKNIAIPHHQVKFTPFHVMILRNEGEALLAQPLSSYLLYGRAARPSGLGIIRHCYPG